MKAFVLLRAKGMQLNESNDKSIGVLIRELTDTLTTLVKSEMALAKVEMKAAVGKASVGVALFAAAAVLAVFALALLVTAGVLALALVLQPWAAALVVAIVFLIGAGVLAMVGKGKVADVSLAPAATIANMKTDVRAIKSEIASLKEGR
jgi:uncharacterized membrane protein YqjE